MVLFDHLLVNYLLLLSFFLNDLDSLLVLLLNLLVYLDNLVFYNFDNFLCLLYLLGDLLSFFLKMVERCIARCLYLQLRSDVREVKNAVGLLI
jgi:hypothetical protein